MTPVDNSAVSFDFIEMQIDRTAFKQQSFRQAADHQSDYRKASGEEQAETFKYLMSVAFGFVGKPWPEMEKEYFSSSRRS
jgi:hypothetical protein